ncbi:MAG: two-component regulator propeller domain-containing protein [Dysgonamonadaceae bacterium]
METILKKQHLPFLFFVLFVIAQKLHSQQIISKQLLLTEHLSTSESTDLYQDKEGFIWVGTNNGILRYDGYDIRIFRNNYKESELVTSNVITAFAEDEKHIWVGTQKGLNLINKKTLRISHFRHTDIKNDNIRALHSDSQGNIWIGTERQLYCYTNGVLSSINIPDKENVYVNNIHEDRLGNIWILTWHGGIYRYSAKETKVIKYPPIGNSNNPFRLYQDKAGRYWIATWGDGMWRFNPYAEPQKMFIRQAPVSTPWHNPEGIFYDIIQDDMYGYIWTLSYSGLKIFRVNKENELSEIDIQELIKHQPGGINPVRPYTRMIKDCDGNLWLNSFDKIYTILFNKDKIVNYNLSKMIKDIGIEPSITCFGKDDEGVIWFNQTWYGLCLFDENNGTIHYGKKMNCGIFINCIAPSKDNNSMWLGDAFISKVWKVKQEKMITSILDEIDLNQVVYYPGQITKILEDKQKTLWIGTNRHLFIKKNAKTTLVEKIKNVTGIEEDKQGNVWVSSQNEIWQINQKDIHIRKRVAIPNEKIENLCSDKHNNIWFFTSKGRVLRINKQDTLITDMSDSCALNGDRILQILSDGENIWIIQSKRIICHKANRKNLLYHTADDNIFLSSFRYGASFVDKNKIYIAGTDSYITIEAANASGKIINQRVRITDIRYDGKSILSVNDSQKEAASIEKVILPSNSRNIEIDFSTLTYQSTNRIEYAYYLEGEDKRWTYLSGGKHTAHFNRLGKGSYRFIVKFRYSGGDWSDNTAHLYLIRLPAIHETWYAQLAYISLAFVVIILILRLYLKKVNKKNHIKFHEKLTQAKLNYFTNISHGILTPLTVISCIADNVEENKEYTKQEIGILRSNVERVKRLLIQILDFRKIESNNMPLHVTYGNVSGFISAIGVANFEYLALQKNIHFTANIQKDIWGYVDFEKIDKILFNLLSNAIKYTDEHKCVNIAAYQLLKNEINTLIIEIADEGIGIEAKDIPHIFTKFHNPKNRIGYESNGIGLSLTKELVVLHQGHISVESQLEKGSVFRVEIPLDKCKYTESQILEPQITQQSLEEECPLSETKDSILYIEDNKDLRELMKSILKHKYNVYLAENGKEGLNMLNQYIIDIIICDIMMPQMDGMEFCYQVKNNIETDHIPIIMLTAKNNPEDQIKCYQAGVDSFIPKPFDRDVLYARISNLIQTRKKRQLTFKNNMDINISDLDYQTMDEQFLKKAIECIERGINNAEFDIPQMAKELNVSKSTLNRKLRIITGLTPLEFVRNIKLKHACRLLKKKSISISDVAYATGFNQPKYFSKCFKDEFGITPTEYLTKLADNE